MELGKLSRLMVVRIHPDSSHVMYVYTLHIAHARVRVCRFRWVRVRSCLFGDCTLSGPGAVQIKTPDVTSTKMLFPPAKTCEKVQVKPKNWTWKDSMFKYCSEVEAPFFAFQQDKKSKK